MNNRRGFTLVEMLVVIAIIGVLVGLLIPAVNIARGTARKAQCLSRQRQIGQAMIMYQSNKGSFPGRISMVRTNAGVDMPVSWFTRILPELEQNNLYDTVLNFVPGSSVPYAIALDIAACPSDAPTSTQYLGHASYVVNTGIWDRLYGSTLESWTDSRANGVCHVLQNEFSSQTVDQGYISKNDGTSETILLTENVNATSWDDLEEGFHGVVWTVPDNANDPNPLNWKFSQFRINQGHRDFTDDMLLQTRASNPDDLMRTARPSSNHSGGVNVVFCDGHADFLDENIEPYLYARRLSTSRFQARHPLVGSGRDPVAVQVIEQLPDGTRLPPY